MDNFSPLIEKIESLYPLPPEERSRILPLLHRKSLKKKDFFIKAGDMTSEVGYMIKGLLRYYYISENGKEFTRYFCQGGHFVSSFSALVTGEPSAYFIQALEDTDFIVFKYAEWIKLLDSHPVWGKISKAIQDYALILSEKRERSLILDDAKTRYLNFLKEFPGIEEKIKQYDIASYLGITNVALNVIIPVVYSEKTKKYSHFRPFIDNARISLTYSSLFIRNLLPITNKVLIPHEKQKEPFFKRLTAFFKMLLKENLKPYQIVLACMLGIFLGTLPLIADIINGSGTEKKYHNWQQSELELVITSQIVLVVGR